jgi:hypothetical protein
MSILKVKTFKWRSYEDLADFVNVNHIKKEDILSIVSPVQGVIALYYYVNQ